MADRTLEIQVKADISQAKKQIENLSKQVRTAQSEISDQVSRVMDASAQGTRDAIKKAGSAVATQSSVMNNSVKGLSDQFVSSMNTIKTSTEELYKVSDVVGDAITEVEQFIQELNVAGVNTLNPEIKVSIPKELQYIFDGPKVSMGELAEKAKELKETLEEVKTEELAEDTAKAVESMKEIVSAVDKLDKKVKSASDSTKQLNKNSKATSKNIIATNKEAIKLPKILRDILGIFSITWIIGKIRQLTSEIKTAFQNVGGWGEKAINELSNSINTLKGQAISAFGEVLAWLQPILSTILGYLAKAFEWVSKIIAVLNGKNTYYKAVAVSSENLQDGADSAKQIRKQLMGFDEINQITGDTDTGANAETTTLNYKLVETEMDTTEIDSLKEQLEKIKDLAIAIGIALLAWRIVDFLSDIGNAITGISTLFTNIGAVAVAILFIAGVASLVLGFMDAWNNGVDWKNLAMMIGGVVAIVVALLIVFGPIGAVIGLIVGAVALLIVGIKDWHDKGELTTQTMWLLVGAILALGIALAILIGWPAIIGALILALVIIIIRYWDEIKAFTIQVWESIKEFFVNLWESIKTLAVTVWESIKEFFVNLWDSIKQGFIEKWEAFKEAIATAWEAVKNVFVSAWEAIKNYFSEVFANIKDFFVEPWINAIEAIKEVFGKIKDTFGEKFDDIKKHVVDKFTAIKDKVVGIFDTIKQKWENIKSKFSNVVQDVKNFISDIKSAIKIPKLEITYTATKSKALNMIGITEIPHLSLSWVSAFANGGFPDMGQLFLARESGPELVGKMGNQNAVMNNEQIVSAVSQGVATAVANVMGSGNNNRDIVLEINGREFCRATYNDFNRVQREHGTSLITV